MKEKLEEALGLCHELKISMKRADYMVWLRDVKKIEELIDEAIGVYSNPTEQETPVFAPFQKCPKCDGQGIVSKPPHIAGDQSSWTSSGLSNHTCDICDGKKIIQLKPLEE